MTPLRIESTHTIEIDSFVPNAQIDKPYYDSLHYIASTDEVGEDAIAVIREVMRDKDMVALGRVVTTKRERVIVRARTKCTASFTNAAAMYSSSKALGDHSTIATCARRFARSSRPMTSP